MHVGGGGVILVILLLFLTLQNSWNVISILGDVMLLASNGGVLIQQIVFLLKAHEYHFLFSSSQFRVFRAFKHPNSPTIRSFVTPSRSFQRSSRISKISSCFSLRKFSLRISLYLLGQPLRPIIFLFYLLGMGRFERLMKNPTLIELFKKKNHIPQEVSIRYCSPEWLAFDREVGEVTIPMIAFIEGGMTIPMGRITRDYLRAHRLFP